jgi:hypothetical protein
MDINGKVVLIPTSGLANRLRMIATTIKLTRESNKKMVVYWDNNVGLGADFDDLFERIEDVPIQKIPLKYKTWIRMTSFSSKLHGFDEWYLSLFKFDFIFRDSMAIQVWHNQMNLQNEVNRANRILVCSGQEISYFDVQDYKLFVPKIILRKRIESISQKFTTNTIGVHIRGTDNGVSKKYSPLNVFIKKMEEEIQHNREVTFFVATDEKKYEKYLLEKFGPERIFYQKKVFGRNITEGIKDAVIDLFCLSKTCKIYGSYFSSFSDVAGRIGNITVEVLKKEGL